MVDHQPIVVTPLESTLEDPPAVFVYLLHDLCGTVGEEDELTVDGIYRTLPLSMQDSTRSTCFWRRPTSTSRSASRPTR